jgi:hypothetical protein
MTRLYLAASSRELDRAEAARDYARSLDVEVYDWMALVRANIAAGRTDADLTPHERQRHALGDLRGIADARVFVLLATPHESEARVELGFALALRKPVVISRETCARVRLFDVLGAHECATDQAAVTLAKFLGQPSAVEVR